MLENFEKTWEALPSSARQKWSDAGKTASRSSDRACAVFPGWARFFNRIWERKHNNQREELLHQKVDWLRVNRNMTTWNFPDISMAHPVTDGDDARRFLDTYLQMKECAAMEELEKVWKDPAERQKLVRSVGEFVGLEDVVSDVRHWY